MSQWLTYITTEIGDRARVCDLFQLQGKWWNVQMIAWLFEDQLAERVMSQAINPYLRGLGCQGSMVIVHFQGSDQGALWCLQGWADEDDG